jgi:hypothetical protein
MSTNSVFTIRLGLIVSLYAIACSGAVGSSASPTLAIGMTVEAENQLYVWATPSTGTNAIGVEAQGNEGTIIGGPVSADSLTFWQVSFNDDLTGWTYQAGAETQSGLAAASSTAPTLSFNATPASIAPGASSTLSWSSSNAMACTGSGFMPLVGSGSASVSPSETATYSITCTNGFGSTTRSTSLNVNPFPTMSWTQSLPVPFNNPAIVPFGGTETRTLVFMDGSLYAGIGDWEDPQLENFQTPGAQVLRLDSPNGSWAEDKDFNAVVPSSGKKDYQAVGTLGTAHFDHDSGNNPITPVDVLMAGFWNIGVAGLPVWQKTVTTGSVGAQGTWTMSELVAPPGNSGQVRSFAPYTDSVTHVEMAFAGSKPFGIFSGAFNSASNSIAWGATAEVGTVGVTTGEDRVMSFAACGGKLYASLYDAILVRTDGANPSWQKLYQYSGPALPSTSSGFRGLTCVPNLNGAGSMLISALEGNTFDVYDIPLDGSQATIELHTSNYIASQLGNWVGYGIAAYNNMTVYPDSGSASCPDLIIGLGVIYTPDFANDYEGIHPSAMYVVRHCNGAYTSLGAIAVSSMNPSTPLLSARTIVVSQFSGDPAGTLYVGGYDAHDDPAHNTEWIYRGVPATSMTSSSPRLASTSHH